MDRAPTGLTLTTTVTGAFEDALASTRRALATQGFGVLTEIDLQATFRAKLGQDVPAQVILGACRPELAHRAVTADPSIAALLPCNVVVRDLADGHVRIEAVDPQAMMSLGAATSPDLDAVAADARRRLVDALHDVAGQPG